MNLVFYFLFVTIAIGGVYSLLVRAGQNKTVAVDEIAALGLLREYDPEAVAMAIMTLPEAILMRLEDGRLAVARGMGHHPTIHLLQPETLDRVEEKPRSVTLVFNDFTIPRITLAAKDSAAVRSFVLAGPEQG